jgi:ATP-dependent DNA helicase RecG
MVADPDLEQHVIALISELRGAGTDGRSVEAKSAAGGLPKSVVSSLSAFANMPGGGTIILGLEESAGFAVVELVDPTALGAGLISMARQALDPPVQVDVEEVQIEGRTVVIATVHEISVAAKPCRVLRTGRAYLRLGDGDYEMSSIECDGFIAARTRPRFDEAAVPDALRSDLDEGLLRSFLAHARQERARLRGLSDAEILVKMGVVHRDGTPTVAGVIALAVYPPQFFPEMTIRAALLPAGRQNAQTRVLAEASFAGPVPQMVDEATEWVVRNSRNEIIEDRTTGRVRNRVWPPPLAVRELIANSIVHRDLAPWAAGRAIELRMTSETFRITNPGGLYGVKLSSLGQLDITSARNRRLIDICRRLETQDGRPVEALATGIPAVFEALAADGFPAPQFFDNGLTFTATIRSTKSEPRTAQPSQRTPAPSPALSEVLAVLKAGPAGIEAVAIALDISKDAAKKRLQSLANRGFVLRDGGQGVRTLYRLASRDPQPDASDHRPSRRPVER